MNRRSFLVISCAFAGLAHPPRVFSQAQSVRHIAWLSFDREAAGSAFFLALREGLRELGYAEGRNLTIDAHWGDGSGERLEELARRLVRTNASVIVTQGGQALRPVLRAKPPMPVVFAYSGDPQVAGFIDSLARPGRNLTGVTFLSLDLAGKRIEMLKELMPSLKRLAIVGNPEHPGDEGEFRVSREAAKRIGAAVEYFQARSDAQLEEAFAGVLKARSEAVVVFPDAITMRLREKFAAFSTQHRIPTISGWAQFADAGNLMSYGPNLRASYRRLAGYVDRILKGAKAEDLPVEQPAVVEFVINLRTARAIGISIPQSVLVRADRVIE